MSQPNVPWWAAALVLAGISACGAILAYNDPALVIAPVIKFAVVITNAVLGTFAVILNIKPNNPAPPVP